VEIDYVVDKKGNKYKLKTSCDYGAVLSTVILPELRPISSMCIAPDGFIFNKWRDPEYRGSDIVDNFAAAGFIKAVQDDLFLPNIDKIYGYIHPSNVASSKWVISMGGYMDGVQDLDGIMYDKFVVPLDVLTKKVEINKR
jgi:hypothetical protein